MSKAPKNSGSNPAAEATAEPTRKLQVFAGPCPKSAHHKQTRVYRTAGKTRYCVCDECGTTWKQIGPLAQEPAEAAA